MDCKKARKRAIPFDCKFDAGHEGNCSPYTLPPSGNWLTQGFSSPRMVQVYDVDTDEPREVTAGEAAAGMIRYARRELGAGSPACGEAERQALALLRGEAP